jgi:superfamily II DNA/RNA helicase
VTSPLPTASSDVLDPSDVLPEGETSPSFEELGAPPRIAAALAVRGIRSPFPIQAATIPPALDGRDVCGRAPTGSGKTIAFGIPLMQRVRRARPGAPRALVLAPTRELAAQITDELRQLAEPDQSVAAFYGGVGFGKQLQALRAGVDVAVACPGRLADLIQQRHVDLSEVDIVVLDEADRMADMGFLPEVRRLLDACAPRRQTLLFSATLDGDVDVIVSRYMNDPVRHDEAGADAGNDRADHIFWSVERPDRVDVTARAVHRAGPTVVFCRTKRGADRVARQLATRGVAAVAIHGDRSQGQRERALEDFRSGRALAIVATDVAARGIHVDGVTCVVHFDPTDDAKDYVHRSGRTGRAGAAGAVVSLVPADMRRDVVRQQRSLGRTIDVIAPDPAALPEGPERPDVPPAPRSNGGADAGRPRNRGGAGRSNAAKRRGRGGSSGQRGSAPGGRSGARRPQASGSRSR